jgi:hypothetical protein
MDHPGFAWKKSQFEIVTSIVGKKVKCIRGEKIGPQVDAIYTIEKEEKYNNLHYYFLKEIPNTDNLGGWDTNRFVFVDNNTPTIIQVKCIDNSSTGIPKRLILGHVYTVDSTQIVAGVRNYSLNGVSGEWREDRFEVVSQEVIMDLIPAPIPIHKSAPVDTNDFMYQAIYQALLPKE